MSVSMKTSYFKNILFLLFFQVSIGQILNQKLVAIPKVELHKEIQYYVKDVKKWAKENQFDNYLIVLSVKEISLVQEYNLYVMLDNTIFEKPNAKEFTLIDKTPVFIIKENYAIHKQDSVFVKEFNKKYAKNLFDMEKYRKEELNKYYENAKKYPDSTITVAIGDTNEPATKSTDGLIRISNRRNTKLTTINIRDFKPVIFDFQVLPKEKRPKSCLLLFDGLKLIYKKEY